MTEKQYGGNTGREVKNITSNPNKENFVLKNKSEKESIDENNLSQQEISSYRKAGEIARKVKGYAKSIIKPGIKLIEIAEKIEFKIQELGGKPAFPCNLSINEIAAHYTPASDDTIKASGLLKVDFGVHVNGFIADTAFSLDLENNEENKKLILASELALEQAVKTIKQGIELGKIGEKIYNAVVSSGFSPIRNLSGHELGGYRVHAGLTIPNYNNNNNTKLPEGAYAIEPFSTTGSGIVYDGKPSGIYRFETRKGVRDMLARKILAYIEQEYKALPFCERWLTKKFGERARMSLSLLEKTEIIYQYPQLIEKSHEKVSQAETTILVTDKAEVLV